MKQNIYDNDQFFEGYKQLRESNSGLNEVLEQPALKEVLPALKDLSILELGCGMGQFAKYCIDNGAEYVVGTDISSKMLAVAKNINSHEKIEFMLSAVEDLNFPNNKFDLVVSSLALHYVEQYKEVVSKVYKWLKPAGIFVYSIEHPICTSRNPMQGWITDEHETKLYWAVDNYGEEGERHSKWFVDGVIKYHRKISTLINELINEGFKVEKILEPEAIPEVLLEKPNLINERRRPPFLIINVSKK